MSANKQDSLVRSLGLSDAAALVVGTVIGTGVFIQGAGMIQQTGSAYWVLAAWVAGGVLSLCGALCYAELGCMFPSAGGEYVYLREAYGGGVAFLFGWMRFWIVSPGSIAAYAVGAATFLSGPLGMDVMWKQQVFAILSILIFSGLNCLPVKTGGRVQEFLTALKLVMIIGLGIAIFAMSKSGSFSNLATSTTGGGFPGLAPFGAAMIAALFAYDGWNNMPMAAGEIINPGRNLPRALGLGMAGVMAIYCFANLAYFYALPASQATGAYSALNPQALPLATMAAQSSFGNVAIALFSVLFALSAIGALNGAVLTSARVPYAMARDGLFFKRLGNVSHTTHAPVPSVWAQAVVSSLLALSGTFDQLTVAVVFSAWIFYALAAASLFILRNKMPDRHRDFRVPLYPWMPILYICAALFLLVSALITSPLESGCGLGLTLAGIPVYLWFRRQNSKTSKGIAG